MRTPGFLGVAVATLLVAGLAAGLAGPDVPVGVDGLNLDAAAASAQALDLRFTAEELGAGDPPLPPGFEPETGIGPGTLLFVRFPDDSGGLCSANFIWSDPEGALYLGTAGHCLMPSETNATHGPDADYHPSGTTVYAAVGPCLLRPSTFVAAALTCLDQPFEWVLLGAVVFAVQGGIGRDFGLVHIPEALHGLVRHEVPRWGGPDGEQMALGLGEQVLHYGQGLGWDVTPATRARAGVGIGGWDTGGYATVGFSNGGDSGSATVLARSDSEPGTLEGGPALGIHTHGVFGPGGATFGTLVATAKWYAQCYAGLSVWVEPGGEPLAAPSDCPSECPEECGPPAAPALSGPVFDVEGDATLRVLVPGGEPADLLLRAAAPFEIDLRRPFFPDFGPLAGLLVPVQALDAAPAPCAGLPEDWSVFAPGIQQAPTHPPGEYLLRLASGTTQHAFLDIGAGADAVAFNPVSSGVTSLLHSVSSYEEKHGVPIRISFAETFQMAGPALVAATFNVWPVVSAGAHELEVTIEADGAPCAEERMEAIAATTPVGGMNVPGAGVATIASPQEGLDFAGRFEGTAGVISPTGGPLVVFPDRNAMLAAVPLPGSDALDAFPLQLSAYFDMTCTGTSCTFDASASRGTGLHYDWDFGDGTLRSTTDPVVTHAFAQTDEYGVSLTVTDEAGEVATFAAVVRVPGSLYLTATPWHDPLLPDWNPRYHLVAEAPTTDASGKAYTASSGPVTSTPTLFVQTVTEPFVLHGTPEVHLFVSCEHLSFEPNELSSVSVRLLRNNDAFASAVGGDGWFCFEGSEIPVHLALSAVDEAFEEGDVLRLDVTLWGTNVSPFALVEDLHMLVGSTVHPSRLEALGLP